MKYVLFFISFIFLSCKQKPALSTRFTSIWPKNIDSTYIKEQKTHFLDQLGLQDISSGVDSFEIRIVHNHAMFVEKDLFLIKYSNNKWTGFHYAYQNKWDDSVVFQKREFSPIITWNGFIDSIHSSEILHIPSQVDLINYKNRVADGEYFLMEFATRNKFKLILYE